MFMIQIVSLCLITCEERSSVKLEMQWEVWEGGWEATEVAHVGVGGSGGGKLLGVYATGVGVGWEVTHGGRKVPNLSELPNRSKTNQDL